MTKMSAQYKFKKLKMLFTVKKKMAHAPFLLKRKNKQKMEC